MTNRIGPDSPPPVPYAKNVPKSSFGNGRPLGKSVNILYQVASSIATPQVSQVTILQFDNDESEQLCLTISPPKVSLPSVAPSDVQNYPGPYNSLDELPQVATSLANASVTIEWGTGGVNNKCDVDVLNGLCINLTASYVRVYGNLQAGSAGQGGGGSAFVVQLQAFIGRGMAKSINGQRTIGVIATVDNATPSSVYAVPKFAKEIQLCGIGIAGTAPYAAKLTFWRTQNGPAGNVPIAEFTFGETGPTSFKIPNGAASFTVVGGSNYLMAHQAVFDLAI